MGYSPWGRKDSDTIEYLSLHFTSMANYLEHLFMCFSSYFCIFSEEMCYDPLAKSIKVDSMNENMQIGFLLHPECLRFFDTRDKGGAESGEILCYHRLPELQTLSLLSTTEG